MRVGALCALTVSIAGCADAPPDAPPNRPPASAQLSVRVEEGAPAPPAGEPERSSTLHIPGWTTGLAAVAKFALVGSRAGAYLARHSAHESGSDGQSHIERALPWGDESDLPAETGNVRGVARSGSDILLVADSGAYTMLGSRLVRSPSSAALHPLDLTRLWGGGQLSGGDFWLGARGHIYELSRDTLRHYTVSSQAGEPVAAARAGDRAYVAFGAAVYELDTTKLTVSELSLETNGVIAMSPLFGGGLAIATKRGLFERTASGEFIHYTLSDGDEPAALSGLAPEPNGGAYAAVGDQLLHVRAAQPPVAVATLPPEGDGDTHAPASETLGDGPSTFIAADDAGGVWVARGRSLLRLELGPGCDEAPPHFATHAAPVFAKYCAGCHSTGQKGAPVIAFDVYATALEYADTALSRVYAGEMPPLGSPPLSQDDAAALAHWNNCGRPE